MKMKFHGMELYDYELNAYRLANIDNAYTAFETADRLYARETQVGSFRTETVPTAMLNNRFFFKLSHYVINEALAGSNLRNVYSMLGLSDVTAKQICNFEIGWYQEPTEDRGHLQKIDKSYELVTSYFKFGGDAIHALVEDMTYEEFGYNLCKILDRAFESNKSGLMARHAYFFTSNDEGRAEFIPGIYCSFVTSDKKQVNDLDSDDVEYIVTEMREAMFASGNSLAARAYAMYRREEQETDGFKALLRACTSNHILLVPRSMRTIRRTDKTPQHDPLDALYKECYTANYNLQHIVLGDDNLSNFRQAYKRLQKGYRELISEHNGDSDETAKSILGRTSTKEGQIRGTNLGKRMDYSGRSVIIVNPELSLREIGLPKRVMPALYAHDICKHMAEHGEDPERWLSMDPEHRRNRGISYLMNHQEIFLDNPIPIGRQPTLHKGSITSYYVKPTDNNAMELNPLSCPAFNADFDGDTMHYNNPLSQGAKRESKELLLGVKNPFWAKDGKPTMIPRQEIIYGLNACTKKYPEIKGDPITISTKEAYNMVINNKMHVGTRAQESRATPITTLGRLAFRHCVEAIDDTTGMQYSTKYIYACPVCLELKEINVKDDTMTCPHHKNITMRPVHQYIVGKCKLCGKEVDLSTLKGMPQSSLNCCDRTNFDREYKDLVSVYKSRSDRMKGIYNFCAAYNELITREGAFGNEALDNTKAIINNFINMGEEECKKQLIATVKATEKETEVLSFRTSAERDKNTDGKAISSFIKACSKLSYQDLVSFMPDLCSHPGDMRNFNICSEKYRSEHKCVDTFYNLCENNRDLEDTMQRMVNAACSKYTTTIKDISAFLSSSLRCTECGTVTSKTIGAYINRLLVKSTQAEPGNMDIYVEAVDKLVKLGFAAAKHYAPPLNVLKKVDFEKELNTFYTAIDKLNEMNDLGFMEEETYSNNYSERLKELDEAMENSIADKLGSENGFLKMVEAGARGSKSNLVQIYGYKGRVIKNSTESFNAVIDSCYAKQLSPIQHFLCSYGARRGIMDRSLETANTGYASRQLWHAMQGMVITNEDCGTQDGITIRRSMLTVVADLHGEEKRRKKENELLVKFLVGRYTAGFRSKLITKEVAEEMVKTQDEFMIRSPLTCANPCCRYCYGRDLSTHDLVVVGTPIGIVGAESIGETTSQLTMRTFQGGGVAKKGGIGSAFEHLEAYIGLQDKEKLPVYEPTAYEDGYVYTRPDPDDITKKQVAISDFNTFDDEDWEEATIITVDKDILLKDRVRAGEGLYEISGDQYIPEIVEKSDVQTAGLYLALKIYKIFASQCEINLKHFETLAASMTRALVTYTNNPELNVGCTYSYKELIERNYEEDDDTQLSWGFYKVVSIPTLSPNAVANIDFERMGEGLLNVLAFNREERFTDSIENIVFGRKPPVGSEINPSYLAERSAFKISEDII